MIKIVAPRNRDIMAEEENNYNNEVNDGRRWPSWWIAFPVILALSLAFNGFVYYKYYNATHTADGKT